MRQSGLTIGSLFSGIGGLELGLEWAGHGPVLWQVEQDPWCRSVLRAHWPDVERFEDVRDVGSNLAPVELICGGFPCQDVSAAGSGAGLAGARSGLWWEYARIVAISRPRWVVVENVASGAARWVDSVRTELDRLGYETLPVPIGALDVGAPHLRRRVFIIGRRPYADSGELRKFEQRRPGRRSWRVCDEGQAESDFDGIQRSVADADGVSRTPGGESLLTRQSKPEASGAALANGNGRRRESIGLSQQAGIEGACGYKSHGCCVSGRQRGTDGQWKTEPGMGRVVDGLSTSVDRGRLRALGNAVVPQCAQVVGEIINLIREEVERAGSEQEV